MGLDTVSADTEVVLLLCGRFGGERQEPFQSLSAREYGELAKWLNARGLRPADLMSDAGGESLDEVHRAKLERTRLDFLLGRGTAMALALERWNRGGLWVISRGDPEFPKRLKRHLKHATPPLLYGAGKKELLDTGGLAIIGSRDATESALEFTREVAAQCAYEGFGVVSGGARGVDSAAMQGATDAGGYSIGVLANDLLKASVNRQNRIGLQSGRLVLVSPFYPEAAFNAGNAMGRNKYIYALADRALVIDSALGSGGTWTGAVEVLNQEWVPLYVRTPGQGEGNAALIEKGAYPFTYVPGQGASLSDYFDSMSTARDVAEPGAAQASLLAMSEHMPETSQFASGNTAEKPSIPVSAGTPSVVSEAASVVSNPTEVPGQAVIAPAASPVTPAALVLDMYDYFVSQLAHALAAAPLTDGQIANCLGLEKAQANAWLKRALEEGRVEKLKSPVRYSLRLQTSLLG